METYYNLPPKGSMTPLTKYDDYIKYAVEAHIPAEDILATINENSGRRYNECQFFTKLSDLAIKSKTLNYRNEKLMRDKKKWQIDNGLTTAEKEDEYNLQQKLGNKIDLNVYEHNQKGLEILECYLSVADKMDYLMEIHNDIGSYISDLQSYVDFEMHSLLNCIETEFNDEYVSSDSIKKMKHIKQTIIRGENILKNLKQIKQNKKK